MKHRDDTQPPPLPAPIAAAGETAGAQPVLRLDYGDYHLQEKGALGRAMRSPWFWPVAFFGYVVIGLCLVGTAAGAFGAPVKSSSLSVWASIAGLLLFTATVQLIRGVRRSAANTAVGYLEQAVRLNLPVPAMLRAAEAAEVTTTRRTIRRLRMGLEDGTTIGQALAKAAPGASNRTVRLIQVGEENGRVSDVLRRIIDEERSAPRREPSAQIFLRWYPLILIVAVGWTCSIFGIVVMPKFRSLLADFHRPIPPVLRWVHDWGDAVFLIYAVFATLVLMIYVGRMTAAIFAPRMGRAPVLSQFLDFLMWRLPIIHGLARNRGMSDICNSLADALGSGHSPLTALESAGELSLNGTLRRRVQQWRDHIGAGLAIDDAARNARMPGLLVGMLASAAPQDLPNVLRFLARYFGGRYSKTAELLRGAVIPAMALGFGAVVLVMAYSVMSPLNELTEAIGAQTFKGGF